MEMEFVYLLWHTREDDDLENGYDFKLIGVYSTKSKAEEALARTKLLEGFRDYQEDFGIDRKQIDKDSWTSGFFTEKIK